MRKIPQIRKIDYPALRLSADDVEAIALVMQDIDTVLRITAGSYELSNIAELQELKPATVKTLKLRTKDFEVSVNLSECEASLSVIDDEDAISLGISAKIDSILKKNVPFWAHSFGKKWAWLRSILLGLPLGMTLALGITRPLVIFAAACLATWVFWMAGQVYVLLFRRSLVYLHGPSRTMRFFSENRDAILVGIICTIVSSIVTFLLMKLGG